MGVTTGEGNGYAHSAQEGTDVRTQLMLFAYYGLDAVG
jgi:hypothetical protein